MMMREHFAHCRARSEPISILFAAEPAIYGRFGHGLASRQVGLTIPRRAELRKVPGGDQVTVWIETLDGDAHGPLVARLHGEVSRPGWVLRETVQLQALGYADPPALREGFGPARLLVAERDGEPAGFAIFRRKVAWESAGATGVVRVREAVATDPAATWAIWDRLLDLDLTTEVSVDHLALDDPLLTLLVDIRAALARQPVAAPRTASP